MADITKCINRSCGWQHRCYRATAPVSLLSQSYGCWQPDEATGDCTGFIANEAHQEILEQGRLLAMSAERESALLTRLADTLDCLSHTVKLLEITVKQGVFVRYDGDPLDRVLKQAHKLLDGDYR